jgi:hypothetical protein
MTTKVYRPSTGAQRQYIYSLVGYDTDTKEEAVQWASGDNEKRSTKDLSYEQADRLIKQLSGKPPRAKTKLHPYGAFDAKNPRHRKVLSLCITYGWKTVHPNTGREIADIEQLGIWLKHHPKAPVRKPLKKMTGGENGTVDELGKTIYALERMIKWKFK